MLKIVRFVVNHFEENTYLAIDEATSQAAVIDAGMFRESERQRFDQYLADNKIKLTQIINTHMHLDHCFGANYVRDRYNVPLKASLNDKPLADKMQAMARRFGLGSAVDESVDIDIDLKDGDIVSIGESQLQVIAMPGHSPGGIALYYAEGGIVFTGDSLFERSIGRTDLAGGDQAQLVASVRRLLEMLPPETRVLPGHGNMTTIGAERSFNPYLS